MTIKKLAVGNIINTNGGSNVVGNATIRKIEGYSIFITDKDGTDYQGFSQSMARKLINAGSWSLIA